MSNFQNFILTLASSSLSEIVSQYIEGQYKVISHNLLEPKSFILLGIAIIFKLIEILLRLYSNSNKL